MSDNPELDLQDRIHKFVHAWRPDDLAMVPLFIDQLHRLVADAHWEAVRETLDRMTSMPSPGYLDRNGSWWIGG